MRPLPVAPRPFNDETLRSWADRLGAWYGLDGTALVSVLLRGAQRPIEGRLYDLKSYEYHGNTPRWITNVLADAARLPRRTVQALCQDRYSRWTPAGSLWNVLNGYADRRCRACLSACGAVHDRRLWRTGWASFCPEHHLVFGSDNQAPSDYAVRLEAALMMGTYHPRGQVKLPWPIKGKIESIPLLAILDTLAVLAEYLCDGAEMAISTDQFPEIGRAKERATGLCSLRLMDVATLQAIGRTDGSLSRMAQTRGWCCRRGIDDLCLHALITSLGWLLSDWPGNIRRLLTSQEFSTPRTVNCVETWIGANIKMLQDRASGIMEPFRSAIMAL